ncbi:MAG: putative DNA binding domain-containing protein [Candidatus Sumerlaeota bacterium]|nr:putative DNA binding domain-containing protein [Candidatus Sumerlaeota bacterium]
MQNLPSIERVRNALQLSESYFREFKSALEGKSENKRPRLAKHICADIAEALVAFANADGGELLIGVEDDKTITGVPHSPDEISLMLRAHETHSHPAIPMPILFAEKVELNGKTILFFSVAKGTTQIYQLSDGRCVRRKDRETIPAAFTQIQFERQEVRSREFERQFPDGASAGDLDMAFLQGVADQYLPGLSPEAYLQQIGLAEYDSGGLRLRMAALLLFAKDIQRWHARSQVRILKVAGGELKTGAQYNVISDVVIPGNIMQLILSAWDALRPYLAAKTEFSAEAKFEEKYLYPEIACREALINAIAHRDYSIQNGIEIYIFNNRMEIKNPGALLSTLTIQDIEEAAGAHESRNAMITRVLREHKYMRELGEGIKRIYQLADENDLQPPRFASNTISFTVTLWNKHKI